MKKLKALTTPEGNTYMVADKITLDGHVLKFWKSCDPHETEDTLLDSVDLSGLLDKISIFASDYIVDGILDMSTIPITSNSVICFIPGVYRVKGCTISNLKNVRFEMRGAVINLEDYFIEVTGCDNVSILGGTYDKALEITIKVVNTPHFRLNGARITNVGSSSVEQASGIQLLGNCDNFEIDNCYIDGVSSGIISSDGFIHAYGILINRLNSSNAYTRVGIIKQCTITNVAGIDSGDTKADGDGIFIQAPPYLNDSGNVEWRGDTHILIDNCIIVDCKKRAIKSASAGVIVKDSVINGAFWYAGIDAQYGHMIIDNTYVSNTSDYTASATSAIITNEGGLIVRNCTVKAPYGKSSYHPGIRFNKRLPSSIVPDTIPWDNIYIDNCFFDKVSIPVYGYVSGETHPIPIKGLYVTNCRVGDFNNKYVVSMSDTAFSSIETFLFTDWRLDYGSNRTDVKSVNSNFTYPVSINIDPTITFELHSKHWTAEPMSGYDNLPTSPNGYIEYTGTIGSIYYKKYTSHGSIIKGNRNPSETTATLAKQLLYNSKIGDVYIDTTHGNYYICTVAGTPSDIGTWSQLSYLAV